ncbi:MAG: FkbM family methyltransferase [Pseudomonadota bacterium]
MKSKISINETNYPIVGAKDYLDTYGEHFEPYTVEIFRRFCEEDSQAIDIGANIGLTAIALGSICNRGKVAAIEPIPVTFQFLKENVKISGLNNITLHNFALGNQEDTVLMQGCADFLAGAFVAKQYQANKDHFTVTVPLYPLDKAFNTLLLDRIDFIKLDVEGYELFALEGARQVLTTFKPIIYLEMNHWCLNVFHRITLPEFHERLIQIFPYVFAIQDSSYLDFVNPDNFHHIAHEHVTKFKYLNIIAGFDKEKIIQKLSLV